MTREEAKVILKGFMENPLYSDIPKVCRAFDIAIKALEQESVLDKIFCIVHPLSIISTPELEHKAIMQVAEMLESLCLPESEETNG